MEGKGKAYVLCSQNSPASQFSVCCRVCGFIVIFIIVSSMGLKSGSRTIRKTPNYPLKIFGSVGIDGFRLFMESDKDWDDRLSIAEFINIVKHLKKMPKVLGIVDHFEGFHGWQKPRRHWFNFPVRHFQQFLPPPNISSIGNIYEIIRPPQHHVFWDTSKTSELEARPSFIPLDVEEKYYSLHKMLSMFHQNTFIYKREAPFGGYGVIRARNENMVEIIFRIAIEFQLNDPENMPFWLTPEPLKGSLIISRDYKHLIHFRMYLETDREIHIGNDLTMLKGHHYQITGEHIKEMSLESTSSSVSASATNAKKRLPDQSANTRTIEWNEQKSRREAFKIIDKKMKIIKKKKVTFDKNDFIPVQDGAFQNMQPQAIQDRGFP